MGFTSVSYTENQSSITGENVKDPAAGSFSLITGNVYWKVIPKNNFSTFVDMTFPLVAADGSSFFGASIGTEYYFSPDNSVIIERSENFKISLTPTLRYYLVGSISALYFSYATESAIKNDTAVSLNLGGGGTYTVMENYAIKADLTVGRGVGVITSSISMRAFFSLIYYWDR